MKTLTLPQFLKLLPDVDAARTRDLIGDGLTPFIAPGSHQFKDETKLAGVRVKREELFSLALSYRVDAAAAGALIRLYEGGALPMKPKTVPVKSPDAAVYRQSLAAFEAAEAERKAEQAREMRAAVTRRRTIIADPSLATEMDFTIKLLNDIFLHHLGPGGGKLTIGGIEVTKSTPVAYASNSGKNRFWSYNYRWTSADGTPRCLEQSSAFEGNRRNDEARNWGLPA